MIAQVFYVFPRQVFCFNRLPAARYHNVSATVVNGDLKPDIEN